MAEPHAEREVPADRIVAADEAASELFAAVAKFYERMAADHAGAKAETDALAGFLARKPGS